MLVGISIWMQHISLNSSKEMKGIYLTFFAIGVPKESGLSFSQFYYNFSCPIHLLWGEYENEGFGGKLRVSSKLKWIYSILIPRNLASWSFICKSRKFDLRIIRIIRKENWAKIDPKNCLICVTAPLSKSQNSLTDAN